MAAFRVHRVYGGGGEGGLDHEKDAWEVGEWSSLFRFLRLSLLCAKEGLFSASMYRLKRVDELIP